VGPAWPLGRGDDALRRLARREHLTRRVDAAFLQKLDGVADHGALRLPLAPRRQQAGIRKAHARPPYAGDAEHVHAAAALARKLGRALDGGRRNRAPLGGEEHAIPHSLGRYDVGTAIGVSGAVRLSSTYTRYQ